MTDCLMDETFVPTLEGRLAFLRWLVAEGDLLQPRELPGDRWAGIRKLAFTWAIMVGPMLDTNNVSDRWCYYELADAALAFEAWGGTGEPDGWHRHPNSGRRRNPDGTEVVIW